MARGFLSGAISGTVLGLGLVSVASVIAPPPQPPEVTASLPGAAEAPQPPRATESGAEPSAADSDPAAAGQGAVAPGAAPDPDTLAAVDADTTAPTDAPQTGAADGLATPETPAVDAAQAPGSDTPVLPNPQALAPMEPEPADDLSISTEPAQPPMPAEAEEDTAFAANGQGESDAAVAGTEEAAPEVSGTNPETPVAPPADTTAEAAPLTPATETPAPQPETPAATPAAPAEESPVIVTEEATPDPDAAPSEETTEDPEEVAALDPLRPQIGRPAVSLTERETGVAVNRPGTGESEAAAPNGIDREDLPPISRFAQPFINAEGKPLMSIVLIDDGTGPVSGASAVSALRSFPSAVSIAVDAMLPDAADRMAIYRTAGLEVLAMVDLPAGSQARDAETTLDLVLSRMPEVVGLLEGTGTGLQTDREAADQVTAILASTGHGLVTQNQGLNTMPKLARKAGVPAAPIFRDFDSKGQTAAVIRRFLDQAAFKAGQEGGVIMLGRLRPDTISALLLWGLQDRAGQVAIAPVSAVLTSGEAG